MQEKIIFENKGYKIEGILHLPEKETNSIVILVHGFTGSKDGPGDVFIELAETLEANGFAVLRFNFRFTTEDWSKFHNMSISGEVSDLKLIIDEMSRGYQNIGIIGESLGGTVSIISYNEKVKTLVLWYPAIFLNETPLERRITTKEAIEELEKTDRVTLRESRGQNYQVGRKFIEERRALDLIPYAERISCPILIVHGDSDTVVPFTQAIRLMDILKEPKKLEKIIEVDHAWHNKDDYSSGYVNEAQKKAIHFTVEWFKKYLK